MRTRTDIAAEQHGAGFDLNQSLGVIVGQLAKKMTAELNSLLTEHGLTTTQWGVLACLHREDGLTQNEVSGRTGIDAATLTELLKRMAARGLVRRARDPDNNRYQRVYLTSHDAAFLDAVASLATGVNDHALTGFSAADRARLIRLLGRALGNLDTTSLPTSNPDTKNGDPS
jgi:DNA-binding MarR family transcriptional regulator